ncbi:hypothetical protein [Parvibaculum sp.]|uniref:hypothetical protein n=1 Tax=Parvibaculum sp. TaxID=2024848 RepID=UPI002735ACC3|nr:hypothetical protein [Parvibaculum sp.]MDP3328744.1 hypothetical protein [Parvibaculum sp.]
MSMSETRDGVGGQEVMEYRIPLTERESIFEVDTFRWAIGRDQHNWLTPTQPRQRPRRRFIDVVGAFEQRIFRLVLAPLLFAGALAVRWFGRSARQKRRVERERTHIFYNSIALQASFGGYTTQPEPPTTKGGYAAVTQAHDAALLCKTLRSTMAIGDKPTKKSWWRN